MVAGSRALVAALVLAAFAPAFGQDVILVATVDRTTVRENESFTYVLRAAGRVSGQPDVSVFERDFDVLGQSTSTRIQTAINGRTEQVTEWVVRMMPRGPGEYTLPPVQLGNQLSNAVEILVQPALVDSGAPADIFMEVELSTASAYVQSQVIYTLRLFVGVGTGRATLSAPVVSGGEAIVERLGEDRQFQTVRGERNFLVRERRYAVFPQASGRLTIGPSTFEAMVIPNRGFSRVQRLRSETVEIEVRPAVAPPVEYPNAGWLPAIDLRLEERWADQETSFSLGVPRTRVLSIVADGLLETQLPELELEPADGIRQYPDQPELERQVTERGIEATRIERFAVIAQVGGEVSIPAAEVPWWNVVDERWEVARIEPRVVPVEAGSIDEPAPAVATPAAEPAVVVETRAGPWPWVAAALGLGWALTVLAWLLSVRRRPALAGAAPDPRKPSSRSLLKQLGAACRVNDAARVQQLLLDWARLQFADSPPTSLGALADRIPGPLGEEIAALEAHLYGRSGGEWSGAGLARLLKQVNAVTRAKDGSDAEPLVPLYR